MKQEIRKFSEAVLMNWGQPFLFSIATTDATSGYANAVEITLDGSNFDLDGDGVNETTPFSGQMLFITGIRILNDGGTVFGGIQIDDRLLISGSTATNGGMIEHAAGQDIYLDGIAQAMGGAGTDQMSSTIRKIWGTDAIVCKEAIAVWNFAVTANNSDIWFRGVSLQQRKF